MDNDTCQHWPIVVIVLDGYEPRLAAQVIAAIGDADEQTLSALWACHGWAAEQDADKRRN